MKYDFTSILERHGQDAMAIDIIDSESDWGPHKPKEGFDFLPMWVADMNFPACPAIPEAIIERTKQTHYGYFSPREEYYNAIIEWQKKRHNVTGLTKEHIGYENGVHGCVISAMEILTRPGDKVFMHSPTYVGFLGDLEALGRTGVFSELKLDENGIWRMDYEDMDAKIKKNKVHFAIFCSPHNPAGRVWERWEIEKAMDIFAANECYVFSDEIWADITFSGHEHIPTQTVSEWAREHVVAAYAPSKTFNLAGLVGSYHIIYNQWLRDRITAFGAATHYNTMNVLSQHALIGAYTPAGHEWLDELLQVLEGNCRYAYEYIKERFDGVSAAMPQGTYMLFLDCTEYCKRTGKTLDQLLQAGWDVGVGWQDGRHFHAPCHIRMNLALPLSRVKEAFDRLGKYVFV